MFVDGSKLCFSIDGSEEFISAYDNANRHTALYHYTDIGSMLKIFTNKTFKFNRLDSMNDLKEKQYFDDDIFKLIFLSSFVKQEREIIPMWNTYTNNEYGVRIGFISSSGHILKSIFDNSKPVVGKRFVGDKYKDSNLRSITPQYNGKLKLKNKWLLEFKQSDIIYDEDVLIKNPINKGGGWYDLRSMGVIKSRDWQYEDESRFIACLRTTQNRIQIPEYDFLFAPLKFDGLDSINITFSPYMSKETRLMIKAYIGESLDTCRIVYSNSTFDDDIRRK